MTVTTWLLLALAAFTAFACLAFMSAPPKSKPHPYVTDLFELADEHIGRHEAPGGETTDLQVYMHRIQLDQDR